MEKVSVRRGRRSDSKEFINLVVALAEFERLDPPTAAGKRRLVDDIFRRRRVSLFVASRDKKLVGYALYFYNYSSFLARPTLYLEDLFVLKEHRGEGAGVALLKRCIREAVSKGCGRMEWAVLTWNQRAIQFYESLGARRMADWYVYRLDEDRLRRLASR